MVLKQNQFIHMKLFKWYDNIVFRMIEQASGDRFPHFQLFKSGLLLIFAIALTVWIMKVL